MTNWRNWLKGLAAAVIGGAATSLSAMALDSTHFNLSDLKHLELVAICGALPSLFAYLKQSPLPQEQKP